MKEKKHKIIKRIVLALVIVLLLGIIGFLVWALDTYKPDATAIEALNQDNVEILDGVIAVYSDVESDEAIMFYPGGQVEYESYLPLLQKLQKELNLTCVMVKMPLNMAIFNPNAGDKILKLFPNIKQWHLIGHSIGGVTASMYANDNQDIIKSLTVLGSYNYEEYPMDKTLTIYGSFNDNLEEEFTYDENIYVIEGGNHSMFGNYGLQKIDVEGTISYEEQQNQTVEIIKDFIF